MKILSASRAAPYMLAALIVSAAGCGGGGSSSGAAGTTPSVKLTVTPAHIAKGGSATLTWTSKNVSTVVGSNFSADEVAGSVTVGPLDATTTYSITCGGEHGSATGSATVVVDAEVSSIPTDVVLYSVQNTSGTSTLYYQPVAGGSPVQVGDFAANVTVFGTNATGTRLLLSAPVNGDPTKLGVFVTDLDGVGHSVRMGTVTWSTVTDASISANNTVLVVGGNETASFTSAGVGVSGFTLHHWTSGCYNAAATMSALADTSKIESWDFPGFHEGTRIRTGGSISWIRWSPAEPKLVFADGPNIWTMDASGANATQVAANGTYPTFESTGTRIVFSRIGDGIYVKDLNSGEERKLASVTGVWNGRIVWH